MKHPIINMALLVSIGSLTACGSVTPPNQSGTTTARNAAIGAAVGAGIGQLWGKDTESTLTGAAIGGLIGSQVRTPDGTGTYQQQPVYNNGGYNQPTYNNGGYNSGYNNGGYNNGG
ncbi:MAG: glycine zipper 2TM domain-containing protein, partial [Cardiobacteriaceae bacterium]|nr:glycine zipper 2TM domain-containing protein [Cardiobacteriaceae bacterium]